MRHIPQINTTLPDRKVERFSQNLKAPTVRNRTKDKRSISTKQVGLLYRMRTQHLLQQKSISLEQLNTDLEFPLLKSSLPVVKQPTLELSTNSSSLAQHIDELLKEQYTIEHLTKAGDCNYVKLCRVYLLLKDKQPQPFEDYLKDEKLYSMIRISQIYAVIVVLIIVILKHTNQQLLRLLLPTFKSVLNNHHEVLLFQLETVMDECPEFDKNIASKFVDIRRLFEMRGYEYKADRKANLIAETYKLKDVLVSTIKKQPKHLALFSLHMQGFHKNSPQAIIQSVGNDPKYSSFIYQNRLHKQDSLTKHVPIIKDHKEYSLLLDLDETLVHYMESTQRLLVRPYAQVFIKEIAKSYQVIVFTSAGKRYADWVIDRIDPTKAVSKRIYRHDPSLKGQSYLKDLEKAGRSIDKSIVVDNIEDNFSLQPTNGIQIRGWLGERHDRVLRDLFPILKLLALKPGKDLREEIAKLKEHKTYSLLRDGFCVP